ncbi:hypothetical protein [Arcobacter vandammei]|uniref:hypothetical protein n=1 Tax=Arcobacter vandammei TaxID=2782243 RepID=UPI0018DF5227|nr:hypothetical protein [Arcobacter vandammei]
MTYKEWFLNQGNLHKEVMKKLENFTKDEILEYFKFENMQKNEPDFCLLYKENKKCHDIEDLNCYLCACPHFRFNDSGLSVNQDKKTIYSICSINSRKGSQFEGDDYIHQDCSNCDIPHKKNYIKKRFNINWFEIMKDSETHF